MCFEISKFADEWGPEKIFHIYDPEVGMKGILVIDNTTLGPACMHSLKDLISLVRSKG